MGEEKVLAETPALDGIHYRLRAATLILLSVLLMVLVPFVENPFGNYDYYGRPQSGQAPDFSLRDRLRNEQQR